MNCNIMEKVGKYSFTIYLLHELAAGGIVWITEKTNLALLIYFRPLINIAIVLAGINIICYFSGKYKWMNHISAILLGFRN